MVWGILAQFTGYSLMYAFASIPGILALLTYIMLGKPKRLDA